MPAKSLLSGHHTDAELAHVRQLVMKYGWNSTCFQIVNPGIEYWFSDDGESVIGYVSCPKTRVVAGAPVCSEKALPSVAAAFEQDAKSGGKNVCYFGAESRLEQHFHGSPGHSKVLLGAQPTWNPPNWYQIPETHKSFRAQLNRARNKGVVIREWTIDEAHDSVVLKACLQDWLSSKGLPPLHFVIEPDTLARLDHRRIFVAEMGDEVEAFLVLSPIPGRNGWLTEQFPHRRAAPNGTVELMMDAAIRKLGQEGSEYVTLGLSPMSKRAEIEPFANPFWLRILLAWMRRHGQRFYNFDGLDSFKAKFKPDKWEPIFAISNDAEFSRSTMYSIALAFTDNAPYRVAADGLVRAVNAEIKWLKEKMMSRS